MQHDPQTTPEQAKLTGKEYEKELRKLQIELCKLQEWVKTQGRRIIVIFEGRDAAGKGGVIKAITERVVRAFSALSPCRRHRTARDADLFAALHAVLPSGG